MPYKTPQLLSHPLYFISSGLLPHCCLINILCQGDRGEETRPAGWSGVRGSCPHPLFNYAVGLSVCSPGWGSLPPSAQLSLSSSRTRLGRGLHSLNPSRGSPLLSLRLSSAPAAPCREQPPFLQKKGRGGREGGRQLGLRLRGRRSPDVIAHCISIKQSILDMECGADG